MSYASVRAITFDAAHTLFHPFPSVGAIYREIMRNHGLDYQADALEAGFRNAFANVEKDTGILDGERRERQYWRTVVKTSLQGLEPQPLDFESLFHDLWETFSRGDRWRVDPHVPGILADLRERGYSVNLLTNWDNRVRRVVDESSLAGHFDHLFISSEIGADKPDPAIFAHVESVLELPPDAMLHVGDSFDHDVEGALAAGWKALLLSPSQSARPIPTRVERIASLSELLPRLPRAS